MLRFLSLISLLEQNKYLRKSLKGFREDMPDTYERLLKFYEEAQAYFLCELLANQEAHLEQKYMLWVRQGELPHIFEIKDHYSPLEYHVISVKTKIPIEAFTEIITATG